MTGPGELEPRWRSVSQVQPWRPSRWARFTLAWEVLEEPEGWEGFRLLDLSLRRAWPDYRWAELMYQADGPMGPQFTFAVR